MATPLTVADLAAELERLAPGRLAEEWDNVGLLVGDSGREVRRIMTCLTVTPESAAEAIRDGADLIVTHHPIPFRPLKRLTTNSPTGKLLLDLIAARVAVYSAHTAFDSAQTGINQRLAEGLGLRDIAPLVTSAEFASDTPLGVGRIGTFEPAIPLSELATRTKQFLKIDGLQVVGSGDRLIRKVGIACGSAGELLTVAAEQNCDCFLTGEARFHACLEAEAQNLALVLPGHFASERFGLELLADELSTRFADLHIWPSRAERDPLRWA